MGVHNNVHIPRESWPHFTWLLVEFAIVFAISNVIAFLASPALAEMGFEPHMVNWFYWIIVSAAFGSWYVIIRGVFLKKPILRN